VIKTAKALGVNMPPPLLAPTKLLNEAKHPSGPPMTIKLILETADALRAVQNGQQKS
jgi:hypothetical protein